jgi:hypothetical protein
MVIAVWLTLNVSADATGLLERPGPRPVDAGRGPRPVSRSIPTSTARSADASSQSIGSSARRAARARGAPDAPARLLRSVTSQCTRRDHGG